jgi:hypothetical protein
MQKSGDTARNVTNGAPLLFVHFPKYLYYSESVAYKVSKTIWLISNGSPIPIRRWLNKGLQHPARSLPSMFPQKRAIFPIFFGVSSSCLYLLKMEDAVEKCKTISGSSHIFARLNYTTCSQIQTDVTIPFITYYRTLISVTIS